MARSAHHFLEEFAGDGVAPLRPDISVRPEFEPPAEAKQVNEDVELAYANGLEEGRGLADALLESEIARIAAEYDGRLAEAKAAFSGKLADRFISELQSGLDHVHAKLADHVLSVLLPVMRHALADATIKALSEELRQLANDQQAVSVELTGPQELVDQVWCRYLEIAGDPAHTRVSFTRRAVENLAEVRVRIDDEIIEARLLHWMSMITEAVG